MAGRHAENIRPPGIEPRTIASANYILGVASRPMLVTNQRTFSDQVQTNPVRALGNSAEGKGGGRGGLRAFACFACRAFANLEPSRASRPMIVSFYAPLHASRV